MISDERIQQTVQTGEKNKQTAVLVHNWCAHARVKRMPGRGMIEEMYDVPIGHMGMECAHAPAGGSFCWELADAALQFHDANCVGCAHRKPVSLPNLSQLVAERDATRAAKKLENERHDREEEDALAQREANRALVRAALDPVAATNLDLLSALDKDGDRMIADKLAEVAGLAPETFPPPLVEYLFAALDQRIARLQEVALLVLARLPGIDRARLVNAALDAVARNSGDPPAAHIIETYAEFAAPEHIEPAVPNLVSVATPGHEPFFHHKALIEEPLLSVYRHRPDAVRSGLKRLLERTEAFSAGLGARGLALLIDHDPKLAGFMTDALLAKLARAKYLLQGDDDGVKGTLTDIRDVAVLTFHAAPEDVDTSIQQYLAGASAQGINELHLVYSQVLHGGRRHREDVQLTQAHRIAFTRLVSAATKYGQNDDEDRFTATTDVMQGDPYELAPLAAEQIDNLLGSAAILFDNLKAALAKPRDPNNPMTFWIRKGLEQRLGHTAEVFISWACKAAGESGPAAIGKVLSFLEALPEDGDTLRAQIIRNIPALAATTEGLKLCLPHFYAAMVGPSQLIRSYAATALGDMPRQAMQNMPPLVFEAFTALLGDPYNIVHQAAVRALERFSLPAELKFDAGRALGDIIMHYARSRSRDRFLVTAIEIFAHRYAKKDKLAGSLGDTLLDILTRIEPEIVLQETRDGLPVLDTNPRYAKFFVRLLGDPKNSEHDIDHLLGYLDRHPLKSLYKEREAFAAIGVPIAAQWFYEVPSLVEALTACGAWSEAGQMMRQIIDSMEDNAHFKSRRLRAQLYRIACDVEAALAEESPEKLDPLMNEWSATVAEEEKHNAEIQQRRPSTEGLFSTT